MSFLNYKHLRYFWTVARVGVLTHAAEQLNVSQSALSVQIRTLEDQLGQKLFERQGRRLVLTEAGRITLEHAETIFTTGDHLLASLDGTSERRPVLRIGALSPLSRNFQIGLLAPLLKQGKTRIVLRSGTVETLLHDLEVLNLDVVLMNTQVGRDSPAGFRSHRLFEQTVSLVCVPELIHGPRELAEIVSHHPLILPTSESSIRTGFDAMMHRLGLQPVPIAEADDMAMLRLLVKSGAGIAPVPPVVVRDELASGELVEVLPLHEVMETFYAITLERQFPNPALKDLLNPMGP